MDHDKEVTPLSNLGPGVWDILNFLEAEPKPYDKVVACYKRLFDASDLEVAEALMPLPRLLKEGYVEYTGEEGTQPEWTGKELLRLTDKGRNGLRHRASP